MIILLVRHGEYYQSIPQYGLTPRGVGQARAAGDRLQVLLVSRVIATSKIVHSQLQRARETAQQQLQEDTLLNEGQPAAVSTFYTSIP